MGEFTLFIIQGTLESAGILAMSIALSDHLLIWKRLVLASFLLSLISYSIQNTSLFYGFHTIACLFLIIIYLWKGYRLDLLAAFVTPVLSVLLLGGLEYGFNFIFFNVFGFNMQSSDFFWSLLGIPQAIVLMLTAILVSKIRHNHAK